MFGASTTTLDHIHQLMTASSPSSFSSGSSTNNFPTHAVPSPITHGTSHPIDTLHQVIHSGYMHDIGSQLTQPFSFTENNVRPGFGSSTTSTTIPPRSQRTRNWPYPPPLFTAPNPLSYLRTNEYGNEGSASNSNSVSVDTPLTATSLDSNRESLLTSSASDSVQMTKFPGQSYPILDVSSTDPKIYHAPHDPVQILKVFATAYEKTGPSGSAEVIGPGTKAHVTVIADGPANIPKASENSIRREFREEPDEANKSLSSKTFPVFVREENRKN